MTDSHQAQINRLYDVIEKQDAEIAERDIKIEQLEDKIQLIRNWAEAYPLDIFPEPDFAEVHAVLTKNKLSLSAVSASNMRHVINEVKRIVGEKDD